jgi:hypothetical protein
LGWAIDELFPAMVMDGLQKLKCFNDPVVQRTIE